MREKGEGERERGKEREIEIERRGTERETHAAGLSIGSSGSSGEPS